MDTKRVLILFAQENGIDIAKVSEFMKRFEEPQTIQDLLKMPQDQLVHKSHVGFMSKTMDTFLEQYVCPERYETVTLEKMIKCIERVKAHEDKKMTNFMKKVEREIINEKYGSIKYDW